MPQLCWKVLLQYAKGFMYLVHYVWYTFYLSFIIKDNKSGTSDEVFSMNWNGEITFWMTENLLLLMMLNMVLWYRYRKISHLLHKSHWPLKQFTGKQFMKKVSSRTRSLQNHKKTITNVFEFHSLKKKKVSIVGDLDYNVIWKLLIIKLSTIWVFSILHLNFNSYANSWHTEYYNKN